jgi:XTP/dITP diphosphohydrolase
VLPDGRERTTTGRMDGRLLRAPVGDNGFGYDPLFVATGQRASNGELDPAEKDRISHRGQAVRAMVPVLVDLLGSGSMKES